MRRFLIMTLLLFNLIYPSFAIEFPKLTLQQAIDIAQHHPQLVDTVLQYDPQLVHAAQEGSQPIVEQQPGVGQQIPGGAQQQPVIGQPQPGVEPQLSHGTQQLIATGRQLPGGAQQQPVIGQPQPIVGEQPIGGAQQPPIVAGQQPGVGPQLPGGAQQPPGVGQQIPGGAQQPVIGQPQPIVGEQPIGGAQQPIVAGQQPGVGPQLPGGAQQPPGGAQQQPAVTKNRKIHTLKEGFYTYSCPGAEQLVADEVRALFKNNGLVAANFIRLLFHDCFVNGCDASLLLDSMPNGEDIEKFSRSNGELLKGSEYIDDIKAKLEEKCPQTVSCADIMAFAAMEAMALVGIPRRPFLGGRRDGNVSLAFNVDIQKNLPFPEWTMDQVIELFGRKGFSIEDIVILVGAHSVGVAHCNVFANRLYSYTSGIAGGAAGADPDLSQQVVSELTKVCKKPGTPEARANPTVNFDETPTVLDNLIYKNLVQQRKALLATDQHMFTDPRTSPYVLQIAQDMPMFQNKFADLMVRLSSLDVLLGKKRGEVRKTCRSVN